MAGPGPPCRTGPPAGWTQGTDGLWLPSRDGRTPFRPTLPRPSFGTKLQGSNSLN